MERFPLPLGACGGLRYFIVALPEPSINYFAEHRSGLSWSLNANALNSFNNVVYFDNILITFISYAMQNGNEGPPSINPVNENVRNY